MKDLKNFIKPILFLTLGLLLLSLVKNVNLTSMMTKIQNNIQKYTTQESNI